MKMAKACGATRLKFFGDSQLLAQQVMNQCDAVNDSMVAYKEVYNELEKLFDGCEVNHISRLSNDEADVLANIGSQCLAIPPGVFWEEITERSTKPKKAQKKEKEEKTSTALKEAPKEEEDQELVMMVEYQLTKLQKDSRGAAAIAKLQFGDRTLCSGTAGRGSAPEAISIDATASIMLRE
ncbi:hypothetical protein QYE76_033774 [Lolium multiflorum]|uniref:RNase H type-1 domain-containing protein n=1 Tax=Lolium multiflorum TaxID=4521 RepID=A0AAD8VLV1_LOLMU|nr:hypothetical protein QYE76_033774 [Lolium multiflorum]